VLLRKFFSVQIPDSYDFGRFLLGILIFWGIAATSYRGTHITVDLFYANVGPRMQRFFDVFATYCWRGFFANPSPSSRTTRGVNAG
jgi:TRAP-type C4-dicarboxylate transport system permease small subunit